EELAKLALPPRLPLRETRLRDDCSMGWAFSAAQKPRGARFSKVEPSGSSSVSVTELWRTHSCVPRRDSSRRTVLALARVPMRHARVRAPQASRINNFNRGLLESVQERASARSTRTVG